MFNYENIGEKIKELAKIIFAVEAILLVISGIYLMFVEGGSILYGLLVTIVGPILAWISSWLLYGFGQLIENSDILVENSDIIAECNHYLATNCDDKQNTDAL